MAVLRLPPGDNVRAAVARLMATGRYEYVEPDYTRHGTVMPVVPDDPQFGNQWALSNAGENGGIAGADIDAEAGWETRTDASPMIVGMLDSGALTTHQDLVSNLWVNPKPNTTTSYSTVGGSGGSELVSETDSINGLNAVATTGLPTDDLGHGTHTSGIAASADPMTPLVSCTVGAPTGPRFVRLNRLNISTRSCVLTLSDMRVFLNTERSTSS